MIPTFIRSYEASADVEAYTIVAFSDADTSKKVAAASADTDPMLGVSDKMGASSGGMVDVIRSGLGQVTLGGTVEAGDPLTSDANGAAVKLTASAGENRRLIGFAEEPGVSGDVIDAWIQPGLLYTPAA